MLVLKEKLLMYKQMILCFNLTKLLQGRLHLKLRDIFILILVSNSCNGDFFKEQRFDIIFSKKTRLNHKHKNVN